MALLMAIHGNDHVHKLAILMAMIRAILAIIMGNSWQ